jgi:hypothetical protein
MHEIPKLCPLVLLVGLTWPLGSAFAQTNTSTAFRFPEEGGPLPRAETPEGGVERNLNEVPGGPCDRTLAPGEKRPAECLEAEKSPEKVEKGGEPPGPEQRAPSVEAEAADCERNPNSVNCPAEVARGSEWRKKLAFSYDGYVKVIAETIQTDQTGIISGRNNGFRLGNARLGFLAMYDNNLRAYISIDASVGNNEDINFINNTNQTLTVGPRDAYLAYDITRHASVRVGRFKAPYDISILQDEGGRIFIDLPVETRGVDPTQGFLTVGLRQDREIGVMLHRERLGFTKDGFDLGYALALTNGRTEEVVLNDNNQLAGFARFSLYWGSVINVNVGGFTDTVTVGSQPNLFDQEVKGFEASAVVRIADLRLEGQYLIQRTDFQTTGEPHVNSQGFHAQASYRFTSGCLTGFEAAYRFAFYDPNQRFSVRQVNEHTLGVSYYLVTLPLRVTANYTFAGEPNGGFLAGSDGLISNNRFAGLLQFNF